MRFDTIGSTALVIVLGCAASLGGCGESADPGAATPGSTSEAGPAARGMGGTPTRTPEGSGSDGNGAASAVNEGNEDGTFDGRVVGSAGTNGGLGIADAGLDPDEAAAALQISPARILLTGVRGLEAPVASRVVTLHNPGARALTVTRIALSGADADLFRLADVPALPSELAVGAELSLAIELATDGALPPEPPQDDGGTALTARLDVTTLEGAAQAGLNAVVLTTATHEPTLGQILDAAGIPLNVGLAQNNANPNTGGVASLPGVEAGTDEIAGGLFRRAGPGEVTIGVIARFSPKGPMPFGWYPRGEPETRNAVATMASSPDAQTSDKARMLLPPVTGATRFDPGAQVFGIWVYTDQLSQRFDVGGNAANGDYNYSEDAPNSPPNVHRTKVYPLEGTNDAALPNSFLLAVEEAANGDYQDYVLVIGNVEIAP